MHLSALIIFLLISFSASAVTNFSFLFDEFRDEIKQMAVLNHRPAHSYKRARKMIMQKVHLKEDGEGHYILDVYCKIQYRAKVGPLSMPSHERLNVEHTWPRSRFGSRVEFVNGIFKKSKKYKTQESDLHHLYPSDSKANSKRSNFVFSQFGGTLPGLSLCPYSKQGYISSIDAHAFEPPESHKGNVARALFYFAVRYDLRISAHEEFFLRQWNIIDPVDEEEVFRNNSIESLQGNRNPFVDEPELSDLINDF